MKKYQLYGIGAALVDTEVEVTDQDLVAMGVDKGLMTLVDENRQQELADHLQARLSEAKRASGGSACNSVFAASCFGASTFFSGKVADDDNGAFFLKDLQDAGVDCNAQNHSDAGSTGKCLVLITPDAERSMNTNLGISESLSSDQIDEQALTNAEYLYIEGYLVTSDTGRAAAVKARQLAEQQGVKTAITLSDPGMVQFFKDGLLEMIGNKVDLLFCNEEEAKSWTGCDDLNAIVDELQKTATQFAITRGDQGALLFDGKQTIAIDPHTVKAVDSNGAGDMFAGAFLFAITQGQSFEAAGKLASLASATVVSQYGPRLTIEQHHNLLATVNTI